MSLWYFLLYRDKISTTNTLKYEQIATLSKTQDGAICGDYIFTFSWSGTCRVYSMSTKSLISSLTLDKNDLTSPHSNSICFGVEKYNKFPLLYSNIYNNEDKDVNNIPGVCNIYRIQREGDNFTSTLLQVIKIGFTSNNQLWPNAKNVRPYGDFLVDNDNNLY